MHFPIFIASLYIYTVYNHALLIFLSTNLTRANDVLCTKTLNSKLWPSSEQISLCHVIEIPALSYYFSWTIRKD